MWKFIGKMNDRLRKFLDSKGISVRQFEQMIGSSDGKIAKFMATNSSLKSDTLSKIMEVFPQLSIEWLLAGEGDMLKTNQQSISNIDNSNVVGANVNGTGININSNQSELLAIIRKQQEQMDKLIDTIANMHQ